MNNTIKPEQNKLNTVKEMLKNLADKRVLTAIETCVRCGMCAESCHYYQAEPRPEHTPYYRAEQLRKLYRRFHDPVGRLFPKWIGAQEPTDEILAKLAETAFSSCTLCQRCTISCPFGVETSEIMRIARSIATAEGLAPEMLTQLADMAISREENAELYRDFFISQIKEIEQRVQAFLGDPQATIPIEKEGARILYVPLSGEHTIFPESVIFNLAKESWTMSMFEAANYGVFLGDTAKAKRISERILKEAERMKVKEIVLTECGHAYTTLRWEAPKWFGGPLPFKVRNIIEVLDEYLQQGLLQIDPSKNPLPVTYHDSCNLGRKGGLLEEPRHVLKAVAGDFREMTPNRLQSLCCGAGSGMVAIAEWSEARIKAGKPKADQVKATGAKVVVTSCDNCRHQMNELNEVYHLGITVTSLCEMVVQALVVPQTTPSK